MTKGLLDNPSGLIITLSAQWRSPDPKHSTARHEQATAPLINEWHLWKESGQHAFSLAIFFLHNGAKTLGKSENINLLSQLLKWLCYKGQMKLQKHIFQRESNQIKKMWEILTLPLYISIYCRDQIQHQSRTEIKHNSVKKESPAENMTEQRGRGHGFSQIWTLIIWQATIGALRSERSPPLSLHLLLTSTALVREE